MTKDMVKNPNHYILRIREDVRVEVLEVIKSVLTLEEYKGYLKGNVTKYILRSGKKHEKPLQDYQKAREYLNYLIDVEEAEVHKSEDFRKEIEKLYETSNNEREEIQGTLDSWFREALESKFLNDSYRRPKEQGDVKDDK